MVSKASDWLGKVSPSLEYLVPVAAAYCLSCVSEKFAHVIKEGQLWHYHGTKKQGPYFQIFSNHKSLIRVFIMSKTYNTHC
jgi:hypothetical protein